MPRPRGLNLREMNRRKALALVLIYDGVPALTTARYVGMDVRTVRKLEALVVREAA